MCSIQPAYNSLILLYVYLQSSRIARTNETSKGEETTELACDQYAKHIRKTSFENEHWASIFVPTRSGENYVVLCTHKKLILIFLLSL